jgi:Cdc6-like AAA superfamily ATPase
VVLVVDEVDQLVKRSGSVETGCALETLFSLPLVADMPPMAIIGIANAVDLLNRSVAPVSKGLATSLLFEPYTAAQLRDIMTSRFAASKHGVTAEKNLGRVGMELRVRQVAKHSGDCRRLLTSCNQAIAEVVAAESASLDNTDVACALAQNGADALKKAPAAKIVTPTSNQNDPLSSVMHLPIEQQMLLCALAGSKAETARLSLICSSYKDLCRRLHQPPNLASKGSVGLALSVLEDRGLLVSHAAKGAVHGRSTPRGSICGDRVVELAVSREALRKSIARVNPLLERCMSD